MSGIAYSAIMLGVLLPKLNIWMTRKKGNTNKAAVQNIQKNTDNKSLTNFTSMNEFSKKLKEKINK